MFVLPAHSGWEGRDAAVSICILSCTGHPPTPPQNYVAPNVSSARVERPDNTLDSSSPLKPVFGSFSDNVMDVRAVVFISNI